MTTTRRLAAILAADVAGYSRLMAADEAGTLALFKRLRVDLIDPKVAQFGGRLVGSAGDSLLIEFPSAVDAVQCAMEVQQRLAEANELLATDRRMAFRMGVNLGDVIAEDDTIHGDGVNVAARLEKLAEPGAVCVARNVHDQVKGKLPYEFKYLGEQQVRNIAEPVRAYTVRNQTATRKDARDDIKPSRPNKPSIAVLPFTNMSGDPEQEYFADGITEDLITALSRFKGLFVIARNSSFQFKGRSPRVQDVGRELGVRWVVEGSVRKAGGRVRITAQLIDAESGAHVWAERYDRTLEDIFEVQDEVVRAVAGTIPGHLDRFAIEHARGKPPTNPTAFDCVLRGRWALHHTADGLRAAIDWLERALDADPNYAEAHALVAYAYSYGLFVLGLDPEVAVAKARAHAARAVVLDGNDAVVNAVAAIGFLLCGDHGHARVHSDRAIAINSNDAMVMYGRAIVLAYLGAQDEALEWFARMETVDPYASDDVRIEGKGDCLYMLGQYEQLIEMHGRWQEYPYHDFIVLAAAHARIGDAEAARTARAEYEKRRPPEHDIKTFVAYLLRVCAQQKDRDNWLEGFRKAGFDV